MVATYDPGLHRRRACLLQVPAPVLFNRLCGLGRCTLILREQGLSLARKTAFGLFVAGSADGQFLPDRISLLEIDLTAGQRLHLLEDRDDGCPLLTVSDAKQQIGLTIRLEEYRWEMPAVQQLLQSCDAIPVDPAESWTRDAGAWLDDWAQGRSSNDAAPLREEVQRCLRQCRVLEVAVTTGAQHAVTRFTPAFYDTEGSVFRIADSRRQNVVFADIADASFRMEVLSPSHLLIRREPRHLCGSVALTRSAA